MGGWSKSPALFAEQIEEDLVKKQRQLVTDIVDEITERAPIDTGQYMANNIVSIGSPDYSLVRALDRLGLATSEAARAVLTDLKPYSLVYIQNNVPYGEIIEFGKYNGPTVKVDAGGFSRQAPKGVYGLSFISVAEANK